MLTKQVSGGQINASEEIEIEDDSEILYLSDEDKEKILAFVGGLKASIHVHQNNL